MTRALVLVLVSCATMPEPVPVVAVPPSCVPGPPPNKGRWMVVSGKGEGIVCLDEQGARELALEVEARRSWDERVWNACRP
jgi:hypothetical protein